MSRLTGRGRLAAAAVACFVAGAILMLLFELPATRVAGILLLGAWIVLGAFAVASPDYLAREDRPDE